MNALPYSMAILPQAESNVKHIPAAGWDKMAGAAGGVSLWWWGKGLYSYSKQPSIAYIS